MLSPTTTPEQFTGPSIILATFLWQPQWHVKLKAHKLLLCSVLRIGPKASHVLASSLPLNYITNPKIFFKSFPMKFILGTWIEEPLKDPVFPISVESSPTLPSPPFLGTLSWMTVANLPSAELDLSEVLQLQLCVRFLPRTLSGLIKPPSEWPFDFFPEHQAAFSHNEPELVMASLSS